MTEERTRQLAAIMFADMVGYTALMQEDEERARMQRDRHREVLTVAVARHHGEILQYYGDGTLSIFNSAVEAVECAVAVQLELQREPKIPLRIGVHTGDIVHDRDGVYGDGVNVASRIESLAASGGILVSGKVYDEIKNHPSIQTSPIGSVGLRNVKHPVKVFAVSNEGLAVPTAEEVLARTEVPVAGSTATPSGKDALPATEAFVQRLKERSVIQWAALYLAGVWALVEAAGMVGGVLEWTTNPGPISIVIAILGFFLTLVLAWYHGEKGRQRVSGPELLMIALLLAIGGGFIAIMGPEGLEVPISQSAVSDLAVGEKPTIAVLPLTNMSAGGGEEAAFLAMGLHDDLLTQLSKIASVEVIARTSVVQYANTEKTIPVIGEELGAHAILEGSVMRAGDQVRLNIQLIDVGTNAHLWAETYDREFTVANVFSIQTDLARQVARALEVELAPAAVARIAEVPTENAEAYALYLQGKTAFDRPGQDPGDLERAHDLLSRAVQVDPQFALAHAWLSSTHSWIYWFYDRSETRLEAGRSAADEAHRLDPDLPEVHLARAYDHFIRYEDDAAWEELAVAEEGLPGSFRVLFLKGQLHIRRWEWDESLAVLEQAARLDPFNPEAAMTLGEAYAERDRWPEADAAYDRALEIDPTLTEINVLRGYQWWVRTGDPTLALETLASLPPESEVLGLRDFFQWLMAPSLEVEIAALGRIVQPTVEFGGFWWAPRELLVGYTYEGHDDERAVQAFESAITVCRAVLERRPNDPRVHGALGRAYAALGMREEAVREARLIEELLPITKDPLNGRDLLHTVIFIYAELGMADEVVEGLEKQLTVPIVPPWGMLMGPDFDRVRDDPRIQALIERYRPGSVQR